MLSEDGRTDTGPAEEHPVKEQSKSSYRGLDSGKPAE